MKDSVILPRVPSELLQIALDDMKKTVRQGFVIDMDLWGHGDLETDPKKHCSVCFAGSVMLQTTKKGEKNLCKFTIQGVNRDQYHFLNYIRDGELAEALTFLNIERQANPYLEFREYIDGWVTWEDRDSNSQFYKQVKNLIKLLKGMGL